MKFQLNLKALDGDEPRDTAVGAGAVGVMADAVSIERNKSNRKYQSSAPTSPVSSFRSKLKVRLKLKCML